MDLQFYRFLLKFIQETIKYLISTPSYRNKYCTWYFLDCVFLFSMFVLCWEHSFTLLNNNSISRIIHQSLIIYCKICYGDPGNETQERNKHKKWVGKEDNRGKSFFLKCQQKTYCQTRQFILNMKTLIIQGKTYTCLVSPFAMTYVFYIL